MAENSSLWARLDCGSRYPGHVIYNVATGKCTSRTHDSQSCVDSVHSLGLGLGLGWGLGSSS